MYTVRQANRKIIQTSGEKSFKSVQRFKSYTSVSMLVCVCGVGGG